MAATKAKFLFDSDFAAGDPADRPVAAAEHAVQLAEAEKKGFRDGYAAAEREQVAEADRRTAAAFEGIDAGLDRMARGLATIEARIEAEAIDVAVAVARKLAAALIEREPLAEITALAGDCRIDWADGGLIRDRAATENAISQAVGRYIAATHGVVLPELGDIRA